MNKRAIILLSIFIIIVTVIARVRLLNVPVERDVGGYAYVAQLILRGELPYKDAHDSRMPGLYGIYALILALFGQTKTAIHAGLLLTNLSTAALLFFLGRRLFDSSTGAVSCAAFALLSFDRSVQGIFANSEHFLILPVIGGILILIRALEQKRPRLIFLSGFLFGLSFVVKHNGIIFITFGAFYIFLDKIKQDARGWRDAVSGSSLYLAGSALPFALCCAVFFLIGAFDKFWFWIFEYPKAYVSLMPLATGIPIFKERIFSLMGSMPLLWYFAFIGLSAVLWDEKARSRGPLILSFFLFSLFSVCPGFYFRPHYFILFLPAAALCSGIGVTRFGKYCSAKMPSAGKDGATLMLAALILFYSAHEEWPFLFKLSPKAISRVTYTFNPFPESEDIARYIRNHTDEGDKIAVLGSEPQIYFYSGRLSATRYIHVYPMMQNHKYALGMQKEFINQIESSEPKFLIFVNIPTSWLARQDSQRLIFNWFGPYCERFYSRVGVIDMISPHKTEYYWDDASAGYEPRSQYWISVFERKR